MDLSEAEFSKFVQALQFAAEKHRKQKRKDGLTPYINHPIEVTELLWRIGGVRDIDTLVAALLHDTIEDTSATPDEVREAFGDTVLSYVMEVTDDKSQPKPVRKQRQIEHAAHLSPQAQSIKLADKINNVHSVIHLPPTDWSDERKQEYLNWADRVVAQIRGSNPALEALFDQEIAEGRKQIDG